MNDVEFQFKIQEVVKRLLPEEREELRDLELGVTDRTLINWLNNPRIIKRGQKLVLTAFVNKTLDKDYSLEELFKAKKKEIAK